MSLRVIVTSARLCTMVRAVRAVSGQESGKEVNAISGRGIQATSKEARSVGSIIAINATQATQPIGLK